MARNDIQALYVDFNIKEWKEKRLIERQAAEIMRDCIEAINKLSLCEYAMYLALKEVDKHGNDKMSALMFDVLFSVSNESFFNLIKSSAESLYRLQESLEGEIKVYDFCYKKQNI